jgi:hypothetical protein
VLGILPVRYIKQWPSNRAMLGEIHALAGRFGHPVLELLSRSVSTYSLRGGLWRQAAGRLLAQERDRAGAGGPARGRRATDLAPPFPSAVAPCKPWSRAGAAAWSYAVAHRRQSSPG